MALNHKINIKLGNELTLLGEGGEGGGENISYINKVILVQNCCNLCLRFFVRKT